MSDQQDPGTESDLLLADSERPASSSSPYQQQTPATQPDSDPTGRRNFRRQRSKDEHDAKQLPWIITFSAALTVYNAFGIYFLFMDYSVCDTLWLWVFALASIVLNVLIPAVFLVCFHAKYLGAASVYFALGMIGLLILYTKTCSAMRTHGLYQWAAATVAMQLAVAVGAIIYHIWFHIYPF